MHISLPVHVRARTLTGFAELVNRHGGDPEAMMVSVGLHPQVLGTPDAMIPFVRAAALVDLAAEMLGLPDFGLRLSEYQDVSILGPIALAARYAANVRDALQVVGRLMPYHTPGTELSLDSTASGTTCLRCALPGSEGLPARQVVELAYVLACKFLRMVTRDAGADWIVSFPHGRGTSLARYRKAFGCTVRFDQPVDALMFPSRLLDVVIDQADDELRRSAERYIANVMRRHPLDIGRQTAALVGRQLAGGQCSLELIARQLGLHKRTLQRRLGEQDLQFEDIVDGLRRERAIEYLSQSSIPLMNVAALLGYSDQAAFIRACRRWFGESPRHVRRHGPSSGKQ
ncbi:HTH-type transcriptional regulator VirS [Paraburkholderia nemoris]|uniref:AraC family transcriptional regulator n=1 Tax=Paraburkholderia nemoris TaxID=2793076 RepID=UPI00190B999F|nr:MULTISPECIES: AraC family transcriptional regulator [Paraburkholderia]MBK3785702.1 AraC family transcriptional regulator [Paraburkholderia aspalathi]CAE6817740.1 HTH-type transcriptional regulator VirS [Paraburkholderia nemoris]